MANLLIAEYIWIDAASKIRSKSRTLNTHHEYYNQDIINEIPLWNFDGSSTGDSTVDNSEIILHPKKIVLDVLRNNDFKDVKLYHGNKILFILVLCDCYDVYNKPIKSNNRYNANIIFEQTKKHHPWFGFEQEYVLYNSNTKLPIGWSELNEPEKQGKYYCGVGSDCIYGRHIIEEHYKICIETGLLISGVNAEVMPGQWEYQIGPCESIDAADQLWLSRYLLLRLCEKYNITVNFDPKPVNGDWNGSGLHTNFSYDKTRNHNGIEYIYSAIDKLKNKHREHLLIYGDNTKRLNGMCETSNPNIFSYGVANRSASIRIPSQVFQDNKGYFEDRRPASNADPYLVSSKLSETILLL